MSADFSFSYDDSTGQVDFELPDTFSGADIDEILEYTERKVVEIMVNDVLAPEIDDAYDGEHLMDINSNSAFSCTLRALAASLQEEVGVHYDRFTFFRASAFGGDDCPPELDDAETVTVLQLFDDAWFAVETS